MGLRPETAFGCAFRFLFEPNNVVQKSPAMEMARKFSPPQMEGDVLRIGIQVCVWCGGSWIVSVGCVCVPPSVY